MLDYKKGAVMKNNNHFESMNIYEAVKQNRSQKNRKRREKHISENQAAISDVHRKKRPR